jgi:hypothetical protein
MQTERQIVLGEIPEAKAKELLNSMGGDFANVADAVPKFKKITDFTTFSAEYALIDNNIVIHFFETPEYPITNNSYWMDTFPSVLSAFAQKYFNATSPRLVAKYTEELNSWFFKAQGYGHLLDPDVYVHTFLDQLDESLDSTQKKQ